MKIRSLFVAAAAGMVLLPAGVASAQLPDLPGLDPARTQIADAPRTPSNPAAALPARNFLPSEISRAPASGGSGSPTRLPETGVDTSALALDALTLLGAGTLLLTIRRRLASPR
jgi:hypothetical protein